MINNEIITQHELDKAVSQLFPSGLETRNNDLIRRQLLEQLIDQKIIDLQVKKLGIQISQEEVDRTLARLREEQGLTDSTAYTRFLEKGGMSEAAFREKIREQILRYKLISREIGSKIIISEERAKDYFEQNRAKFQKREGVRLAQIFLSVGEKATEEERLHQKKKLEEIRNRLLNGDDFAALARSFSQDPSAAAGGDLGVFSEEELEPALRREISGLKPGDITPVLAAPDGWRILKMVEIIGAKEIGFQEVRPLIYEELFQEEVDRCFFEWFKKIKDRTAIQILL